MNSKISLESCERNTPMKIQRILFSLPLIAFCFTMASSARGAGVVSGQSDGRRPILETPSRRTSAQSNAANRRFHGSTTGTAAAKSLRHAMWSYMPSRDPARPRRTNNLWPSGAKTAATYGAVLQLGFRSLAPYTGPLKTF